MIERAKAYRAEGELQLAKDDCKEAVRIADHFADGYMLLGEIEHEMGDEDDAVFDLTAAIHSNPKLAAAYLLRGKIRLAEGRWESTLADYNMALQLRPKDPHPLAERAQLWKYRKLYAQAIADYRSALKLDPAHIESLAGISMLQAACPDKRFRNKKQALESVKKAEELTKGNDARVLEAYAAVLAESGDFEQAQGKQMEALDRMPKKAQAEAQLRLQLYQDGLPYRMLPNHTFP
jgi:tetratricopeptide (TPR) repeat protein